jgi:hypothetical protein
VFRSGRRLTAPARGGYNPAVAPLVRAGLALALAGAMAVPSAATARPGFGGQTDIWKATIDLAHVRHR